MNLDTALATEVWSDSHLVSNDIFYKIDKKFVFTINFWNENCYSFRELGLDSLNIWKMNVEP